MSSPSPIPSQLNPFTSSSSSHITSTSGSKCVSKSTCDLLTWKNPIETGRIFASIIITLISLKYFNIINLILRLSFYLLLLSSIAEYAGKLIIGTGFVTRVRPIYVDFFHKNASAIGQQVGENLSKLELKLQDLIYSKDIEQTFKVAIATYFLYKITSWVSIFNLLLTSTILGFTLPLIYELNKEQIDALVRDSSKIIKQKSLEYQDVVKTKAGPLLEKLGPVGSFIQSKLPKNQSSSTTIGQSQPGVIHQTTPASVAASSTGASTGVQLPFAPSTIPMSQSTGEVDINKLESTVQPNVETATNGAETAF